MAENEGQGTQNSGGSEVFVTKTGANAPDAASALTTGPDGKGGISQRAAPSSPTSPSAPPPSTSPGESQSSSGESGDAG